MAANLLEMGDGVKDVQKRERVSHSVRRQLFEKLKFLLRRYRGLVHTLFFGRRSASFALALVLLRHGKNVACCDRPYVNKLSCLFRNNCLFASNHLGMTEEAKTDGTEETKNGDTARKKTKRPKVDRPSESAIQDVLYHTLWTRRQAIAALWRHDKDVTSAILEWSGGAFI